MDKRSKEVILHQLNEEKAVLKDLRRQYELALQDIDNRIKLLQSDEMTQSRIYQVDYQKTLKSQVEAILDKLRADEYNSISQYLSKSYTDGYIGTMYAMSGQGVHVITPIDQNAAAKAIVTDSELSTELHGALGEEMDKLKKQIRQEITRGIATSRPYEQIAQSIRDRTGMTLRNANRIVRTEGHRIQQASADDARNAAKAAGADVVKMWDASLDGATRPWHRQLDGQIRETNEPFEVGGEKEKKPGEKGKSKGKKVMYPGKFGDPAQDCNCRCVALTRARWALDEKELETLKERAKFFGLDKTQDFEDYKKKYLSTARKVTETKEIKSVLRVGDLSEDEFKAWQKKYYEGTNGAVNLTQEQRKALDDYGEGGYELLNAYGRYGEDTDEFKRVLKKYGNPDVQTIRERVEAVDSALKEFVLDDDIMVHRAIRDISYITDDITEEGLKNLKGKIVTEKGFVSTSFKYQSKFTGNKADAVHMELVLPKGTNGAYIDKYVAKNEQEFLLNRNTQYKILDGGERIVKETKFDFKTRSFIEVEKKEKFLKVQVITDESFAEPIRKSTKTAKNIEKSENKGIISIKQAKTVDEVSKHLKDKYQITVNPSIRLLDFDAVKQSLTGIEDMMEEFPEIARSIQSVSTGAVDAVMSFRNGKISFNAQEYADRAKLQKVCDDAAKAGYWPKNANVASIGVHEYAHAIELHIVKNSEKYTYEFERNMAWNSCLESKQIVSQACKNIKKTEYGKGLRKGEMIKKISLYASENDSEAMAEAFADVYTNGKNANPLSIEIRRLTIERLKNLKGAKK